MGKHSFTLCLTLYLVLSTPFRSNLTAFAPESPLLTQSSAFFKTNRLTGKAEGRDFLTEIFRLFGCFLSSCCCIVLLSAGTEGQVSWSYCLLCGSERIQPDAGDSRRMILRNDAHYFLQSSPFKSLLNVFI